MIFGSVCSGIEAASVAWEPLGWRCAFMSEIDAFPRAVLSHHFEGIPLHGDFTTIEAGQYAAINVLVGGTPCQSFSVAGMQRGMDDARGNLALEYLRLANRLHPRWLLWENVPGVLSSNGGRDFGSFLGALGQFGYGFAYRTLDLQFFGIPQRRRRVFVVGYFGDWRRAAAVLFERSSLFGDSAPRTKEGERIAPTLEARATAGGAGWGTDFLADGGLVAGTLGAEMGRNRGLGNANETELIAFTCKDHAGGSQSGSTSPTLRSLSHDNSNSNGGGQVAVASGVSDNPRRITPRECERLMGFEDDWTLVPYRGKPASDGPRYRAIGNSMGVPVVRWIGARIEAVERLAA